MYTAITQFQFVSEAKVGYFFGKNRCSSRYSPRSKYLVEYPWTIDTELMMVVLHIRLRCYVIGGVCVGDRVQFFLFEVLSRIFLEIKREKLGRMPWRGAEASIWRSGNSSTKLLIPDFQVSNFFHSYLQMSLLMLARCPSRHGESHALRHARRRRLPLLAAHA